MYFFRDRFVFPNFVSKKCFSTEFVFLTKIVILHNRGSSMAPKTKKLGIKHNQAVVGGEGGEKKLHSFSQFLSTHPPPPKKRKKHLSSGDTPQNSKTQKSKSRVGKKTKTTKKKQSHPTHHMAFTGLASTRILPQLTLGGFRQFPPPQ